MRDATTPEFTVAGGELLRAEEVELRGKLVRLEWFMLDPKFEHSPEKEFFVRQHLGMRQYLIALQDRLRAGEARAAEAKAWLAAHTNKPHDQADQSDAPPASA